MSKYNTLSTNCVNASNVNIIKTKIELDWMIEQKEVTIKECGFTKLEKIRLSFS